MDLPRSVAGIFRRYPDSRAGGTCGPTLGLPSGLQLSRYLARTTRGLQCSRKGNNRERGKCVQGEPELSFQGTGATIRRMGYNEEEDHVGQ